MAMAAGLSIRADISLAAKSGNFLLRCFATEKCAPQQQVLLSTVVGMNAYPATLQIVQT